MSGPLLRGWSMVALVSVAALVLAGGAVAWVWPPTSKEGPLEPGTPCRVVALGRLEPEQGILELAGSVGDAVAAFGPGVAEDTNVEAGAVLVELESLREREGDLELVTSQLAEARQRYKTVEQSGASQVQVARARLQQAKDAERIDPKVQDRNIELLAQSLKLERTKRDRMAQLSSVADLDKRTQELLVSKLEKELATAETQRESSATMLKQNVGIAEAQLCLAESEKARALQEIPIATLEQQRRLAELRRDRSKLKAPRRGRILKLFARPGEALSGRPVLQMADVSKMVAVAEVYETDVARLRRKFTTGGPPVRARVVSPALADSYDRADPAASRGLTGRVVQIGRLIAKNRVVDIDPANVGDRRVIEVRVLLDDADAAEAAKYLNLQVTVYFDDVEP